MVHLPKLVSLVAPTFLVDFLTPGFVSCFTLYEIHCEIVSRYSFELSGIVPICVTGSPGLV